MAGTGKPSIVAAFIIACGLAGLAPTVAVAQIPFMIPNFNFGPQHYRGGSQHYSTRHSHQSEDKNSREGRQKQGKGRHAAGSGRDRVSAAHAGNVRPAAVVP